MPKKNQNNINDGSFFEKDSKLSLNDLIQLTDTEIESDKKKSANEIELFGNKLINEIDNKNKRNEKHKEKKIQWILKQSDNYTYDELSELTYHDLKLIYIQLKEIKKSKIRRFFEFLFNPQ